MCQSITIRPTIPADAARVTTLLGRSYRALLASDYPTTVLAAALPLMTQSRPRLLRCGTYFLSEDDTGRTLAVGGWTDSSPHGRAGRRGQGHIRHVATDPEHIGQGHARRLMTEVLRSAAAAGLTRLHCQSTLTAEPFYERLGFTRSGGIEIRLAPGVLFPAVQMCAQLD
ncbi:GNAT family N-acetyltransferase [Pseudooceanicola sp.]|uniref:GNAT family N-acetyltransferase n=1 Tax=Pseudooceanicola sp. TaxID=1914328 RepID=UPI002630548D|nr:GNAT family N-acetyltransferase [Pseudooceanicola sp.]MDF1855968.1 GNAT family N-acetyltransferase [Pseudooceanicola sp.]